MKRKNRESKRTKESRRVLIFLAKFNIFAIPLYAILLSGFQLVQLMQLTTHLAFAFLRLTGINAELHGDIISVPVSNGNFGAYVSWDSTGWKSMLALLALIFATDFPSRKKLVGLMLLPAVYLINILRIWFMFFIVTVNVAYFEFAHLTVWSWGLIFSILALWVLWMKKL
jgi:exosortase/archaeosortase family protein